MKLNCKEVGTREKSDYIKHELLGAAEMGRQVTSLTTWVQCPGLSRRREPTPESCARISVHIETSNGFLKRLSEHRKYSQELINVIIRKCNTLKHVWHL